MTKPAGEPTPERVAEEFLGEVRLMTSALGAGMPEGAVAVAPVFSGPGAIRTVPAFREFRDRYLQSWMLPQEWPAILAAGELVGRGAAQELIAADRVWGERMTEAERVNVGWLGTGWKQASCRVGQRQLRRLRPLRDLRVVQRYLLAVDDGKAFGWHPFAFGVVMAAYHLPWRSGLLHFARQTMAGFLGGTPLAAQLPDTAQVALLAEADPELAAGLNRLLPNFGAPA